MEQTISRSTLHKKLVRAAQARSAITLASAIVSLFVMAAIPGMAQNVTMLPVVVYFGVLFVVSWIATVVLCKKMVVCPACGGSLWMCGTGNFKPRRMKVKDGVNGCPHCGIPIT